LSTVSGNQDGWFASQELPFLAFDNLNLSTEIVRNHIRLLLQALGVHTRLEAVAAARAASPD
jgi:DNA-binding CsgD family transcriptional regulator